MDRTIIAISGGGFSEEEEAFIDEYLLKVPRKEGKINIAFIATASNDAPGYIEKFYKAFSLEQPCHFTIQDFQSPDIQEKVNAQDIIYVGGGNSQFMLEIWKKTGFDLVLKNAYNKGVILAGISAGAMCWFETCFSEKSDSEYEEFFGLGILKGSLCPHYNDENRRLAFDNWATKLPSEAIYRLENHENLHFKNENLLATIST